MAQTQRTQKLDFFLRQFKMAEENKGTHPSYTPRPNRCARSAHHWRWGGRFFSEDLLWSSWHYTLARKYLWSRMYRMCCETRWGKVRGKWNKNFINARDRERERVRQRRKKMSSKTDDFPPSLFYLSLLHLNLMRLLLLLLLLLLKKNTRTWIWLSPPLLH